MPSPLLLIGLGNPGPQYDCTRHNIGFMAAEAFVRQHNSDLTPWQDKPKLKGQLAKVIAYGQTIWVIKPTTYMNLSGEAVQATMAFYDIPLTNFLVVLDDVALPLGKLRYRASGSSGGHNGLKSINQHLKGMEGNSPTGEAYARLRLGVGAPSGGQPLPNYVLGRFTPDEQTHLPDILNATTSAIAHWVTLPKSNATSTQQLTQAINGLNLLPSEPPPESRHPNTQS